MFDLAYKKEFSNYINLLSTKGMSPNCHFVSVDNLPENSRQKLFSDYYTRYKKPNASIVIEKYWEISKEHNLNFAQMAIKFCEIQKFLTSVIIGATSMEQLKIDIESVSVNLTDEILKKINDIHILYPNPCP